MSYKFEDVVIDNKLISLIANKDDVSVETIKYLSNVVGKKIISLDIFYYLDALKYLEIDDELHIFVNYNHNNNCYRKSFKYINNILTIEQLLYCCNKNNNFVEDCCESYEAMNRIYDYDKSFFNTLIECYPSHFVKILNSFTDKLTSDQVNNVVTTASKCNVIEYANNLVNNDYIIANCFNGNLQKVLENCPDRVTKNIIEKLKADKDNTYLLMRHLPNSFTSDERLKFVDENIRYCDILNLEELKLLSNNFSSDIKYFGKELRVFERINQLSKTKQEIKKETIIKKILNFIMGK